VSAYIPSVLQRQIRDRFANCCAYCRTAEALEDAHGSAGVGVVLELATGTGFGKAEVVQGFDYQIDADRRADDGNVDGFAPRLGRSRVARRSAVNFAVGDKFF
jgi:hypothetical protein